MFHRLVLVSFHSACVLLSSSTPTATPQHALLPKFTSICRYQSSSPNSRENTLSFDNVKRSRPWTAEQRRGTTRETNLLEAMDPAAFGISTIPLNHEPYGPITAEALGSANKSKVAVVTGAGRGIGRAIAIALAQSGARLALLDRDIERQRDTRSACEQAGARAEVHACDVANVDSVRETFKHVRHHLGEIDILVNNAGINLHALTQDQTFEDFWRVVEVNFKGPMITTFEVLPAMRQRNSGCIINIASRSATVDVPGTLSYCSSKAAVARATSTLQAELDDLGLGENIHTYALHPGGVWTAMAQGEGPPDPEREAKFRSMFKDVPELCGQTCAYLAAGKAKELRGCYFDCRQDVERVKTLGREHLQKQAVYKLKVDFVDGYCNEP